jgi:hypothetical protein
MVLGTHGGVMEKISGIIASNARTRSVDVSRSQPVRPGAPAWGRPEGHVTKAVQDTVTISSAAAEGPPEPVTYKNPADLAKNKVISDVTQKFFDTKESQKIAKEGESPLSEEMLDKLSEPNLSMVKPESSKEEMV